MRILKLTLGKIIFLQIFLQFLFFSVKRPDGLSLCSDRCVSNGRMVRLHVRMNAACHMLMWQQASGRVNKSGQGPHRVKASLSPLAAAHSSSFLQFLSLLGGIFSSFSHVFSVYFVCCAYFSQFQVLCQFSLFFSVFINC
jgi:hypothetical protein